MNFVNDTLHPKAQSLVNHILYERCKKDSHDSHFYSPVNGWKRAQAMSDEKAADLYARLENAYGSGDFLLVTDDHRIRTVSKALWLNDQAHAA